jgi:hypothetical protein
VERKHNGSKPARIPIFNKESPHRAEFFALPIAGHRRTAASINRP